jgi:type IV pilus assembly protein PilE
MKQTGFTMAELLIVVAIVAILAAVALPQYNRTVERQRCQQAQDILMNIYSGERVFWTVNNTYKIMPVAGNWNDIYMENPNVGGNGVAYAVTASAAATFTAKATRNGQTLSMDQTRVISSSKVGDNCPWD